MTNLEKLRGLLQELFQLDQADLDFGIYRIMNQKREEVVRFLDKDLLPQVQAAFMHYKSADKSVLQGELDTLVANITSAGMNPDESPKVKELKKQIAESAVDVTALENEVFSHLYAFFRRYYSEGDFISLRRYKEGVYAIPYEGEEVKLHWANADQYYVKSSETFRDYSFQCPVFSVQESKRRVTFKLVAASTEQDNNKAAQGKERRFVLAENALAEENGELIIRFEYRQHDGKEKQADLNAQAVDRILSLLNTEHLTLKTPLDAESLRKHLWKYTARNTFDYFIHKDLGGFLRRELDFYIKNEVMHLDDIEHESAPKVEQYLSQIKVIRSIAHKIIQFLAQIENFQKKLWLKKKFVIETNYCITLDRVPEELYPEIAANDAQREEWVRLFAIDEIKKDLNGPGYSEPLKVEFLRANQFLLLDTKFFSSVFVDRLLAGIHDLSALNGHLIHGDNFHALSLLTKRYAQSVKCVYSDPPYNTGQDGFPYKDTYQHSCWLSMIASRLGVARRLMRLDGLSFLSTDEHEATFIGPLLASLFGEDNRVETLIWKKSYGGGAKAKHVVNLHEYIWTNALSLLDLPVLELRPDNEVVERYYKYKDSKFNERGPYRLQPLATTSMDDRPNLRYPIPYKGKDVWPEKQWQWSKERTFAAIENDELVFTEGSSGQISVNYKQYLKSSDGETRGAKLYSIIDKIYTQQGTNEVRNILGNLGTYVFPKPTELIKALCECVTSDEDIVLDFFAGSGTTAHAVIRLNKEDQGKRRYILVEMGNYFDTTILPRIERAAYSDEWSEGRPVSRNGVSHAFKYLRLESYEDALNNLELKRTEQQQTFLDADAEMREQYILSYMLDVESRDSQSLLNVEAFRNPDEYKLRVERNGETQLVNVDLVETFNWLLGLTVKQIDVIRGVRVVEGTAPNGDRVLVLWRNIDQMDNDALDKWFEKQDYNTREMVYDLFYVNGDNNLENLRRPDQTWKVRLIEEEFQRLMFDVQDV